MKKIVFLVILSAISIFTFGQEKFTPINAGHTFQISIPPYMNRTIGLNSDSSVEFIDRVKDIAGIVIVDTKEELELAELKFGSINDFYDHFVKDFLQDEKERFISEAKSETKGNTKYIYFDASYLNTDDNESMTIYYFVSIIETEKSYYKMLCFGDKTMVEKYKNDFKKVMYSIAD